MRPPSVFGVKTFPLVFGLVYALAVFTITPFYMPILDAATYVDIAKNISEGRGYTIANSPATDSPVLPIILALCMTFFGSYWTQTYLALSSFMAIVSLYYLAENIRKGSGNISVIVLTTLVLWITLSLQLLTDIIFLVFVNLGVLFLRMSAKKPTLINSALAIGIIASSYLVRTSGIFLIAFAFLYEIIGHKKDRLLLLRLGIMLLATIIVVGGWEILTEKASKTGMMITSGTQNQLDGDSLSNIQYLYNLPEQINAILKIGATMVVFIMPAMLAVFLMEARNMIRRKDKDVWFLLIWIVCFLVPHMTVIPFFAARYILPLMPLFIIIFSDFITKSWKNRKLLVLILVAIHIAGSLASFWWYYPRTEHLKSDVYEQAGDWIGGMEDYNFAVYGMTPAEFQYYTGMSPSMNDADYIVRTSNSPNTEVSGQLCRRFEDRHYWVEVWGDCRNFL